MSHVDFFPVRAGRFPLRAVVCSLSLFESSLDSVICVILRKRQSDVLKLLRLSHDNLAIFPDAPGMLAFGASTW